MDCLQGGRPTIGTKQLEPSSAYRFTNLHLRAMCKFTSTLASSYILRDITGGDSQPSIEHHTKKPTLPFIHLIHRYARG